MKFLFTIPKYFYYDKDSNFEDNNGAYIQNEGYSSINNELNTAGKLRNDLLRNANNIAELASFNDYADEIKTQIKQFSFYANITNIFGVKSFLNKCTS